jgi:hypothetical protein
VGLPPPGIVAAEGDPSSTFLFQPYAKTNNVLLLDDATPSGRLTFVTPTPAQALAFAASTGNGPGRVDVLIHFADGTPDATGVFESADWFKRSWPSVLGAKGRVWISRGTLESANHPWQLAGVPYPVPAPFIHMQIVMLKTVGGAHPVSSIDLKWTSRGPQGVSASYGRLTTHTVIFGVSTSLELTGPFTAAHLTPGSFNHDVVVEAVPTRADNSRQKNLEGSAMGWWWFWLAALAVIVVGSIVRSIVRRRQSA